MGIDREICIPIGCEQGVRVLWKNFIDLLLLFTQDSLFNYVDW